MKFILNVTKQRDLSFSLGFFNTYKVQIIQSKANIIVYVYGQSQASH